MSDNLKEKISIRLTQKYLKLLDDLIKKGIYNNRNEAIRDGVRLLFEKHGVQLASK